MTFLEVGSNLLEARVIGSWSLYLLLAYTLIDLDRAIYPLRLTIVTSLRIQGQR